MNAQAPTAPGLPADLEALMRQLKMPYARALAPELIATARAQRWEPVEIIKALFVEEVTGRSRSMLATRRKTAGFPSGKTFDTWDETLSSIPAPTQQALRTLEWISRKENVVVCGPSGTGKTFFLEALGQQVVARILRADLIVVDDIGLLPVSVDAAEGLYRLVDAAYEKRSIAVSSNLHPSKAHRLRPTYALWHFALIGAG